MKSVAKTFLEDFGLNPSFRPAVQEDILSDVVKKVIKKRGLKR